MRLTGKQMAVAGIVILVVAAGAYRLGRHSAVAPVAKTAAPREKAQAQVKAAAPIPGDSIRAAGPVPEGASAPPSHSNAINITAFRKPGREGIKFAQYRVGNRNVKAMFSDGDTVWVGTSGGVVRYSLTRDDYKLYDVRSGLLSNGIFHLSKLGNKIAVGTYGGGLSLLDTETEEWKNYNIAEGVADAFIYDVQQMDNGDIWIATWSGANRIRGGNLDDRSAWDTYTVANTNGGLPNDWVYGLAKGRDGEIWMATEGGLARFRDGAWRNWKHEDGLGADYERVKDQIQFKRDPGKESVHHARQKVEMGLTGVDIAYNPNYVVALYVDPDGIVWAGTWGGGLSRFDGKTFKTYTMSDGLPANHIFMLGPERNGRMWIGTGNGLSRYDGKGFTNFTVHDGLLANNIFSMTNADDGSLWIGGYGGVSRLRGMEDAQ